MRILVLGSGGLLGSALADNFADHVVSTAGRRELQTSRPKEIWDLISEARPDWVINCAADTNVDVAEDDSAGSFAANVVLPELLAAACLRGGSVLVHFSSTGCYGSWKKEAYDESDSTRPTTTHHRHKLAGEKAVRESGCAALIVRTGWLFGGARDNKRNFVWRRIDEASGKREIFSDPFQSGNPTCISDLAVQVGLMLNMQLRGTYNCAGQPPTTRLEYVRRIVAHIGFDCVVKPTLEPFTRRAKVSPNEMAVNRKLSALGADRMPSWTSSLKSYIDSST